MAPLLGPCFGEHGGCSFPKAYEKRVKFLIRTFVKQIKRHVMEGSGKGQLSPRRLPLGNMEGDGLLGLLRDRRRRVLEIEHLKLIWAANFWIQFMLEKTDLGAIMNCCEGPGPP
jgi:hypothetical protein